MNEHRERLVAFLRPGRRARKHGGLVFLKDVTMYDGLAERCGIYRSHLERQWANWFHLHKLAAQYVDAHWHDFMMDGKYIEIKPHGQEFLLAALSRMPKDVELIVIQGSIFNNITWSCVRMEDVQYVDCKVIDIHKFLRIATKTE